MRLCSRRKEGRKNRGREEEKVRGRDLWPISQAPAVKEHSKVAFSFRSWSLVWICHCLKCSVHLSKCCCFFKSWIYLVMWREVYPVAGQQLQIEVGEEVVCHLWVVLVSWFLHYLQEWTYTNHHIGPQSSHCQPRVGCAWSQCLIHSLFLPWLFHLPQLLQHSAALSAHFHDEILGSVWLFMIKIVWFHLNKPSGGIS